MRKVVSSIGLFLLIGTTSWYSASEKSALKKAQLIDPDAPTIVDIQMIDRTLSPADVIIYDDQDVTLRVTTDEAGEFHIAGYELLTDIFPGKISKILFTAEKQGRFSLEFHPSGTDEDVAVGALLVLPH